MGQNNRPDDAVKYEPEGLVVRQVQWAWVWSSAPWLLAIGVLFTTQWLPLEEYTTVVILIIILVPRYFMWKRTRYTLTEDALIYTRGGITSVREIPLPISKIKDVRTQYGMFGRALGYQTVEVLMDNDAVASLSYVPIQTDIADQIRARMAELPPAAEEEQPEGEAPREEPPSSPPTASD